MGFSGSAAFLSFNPPQRDPRDPDVGPPTSGAELPGTESGRRRVGALSGRLPVITKRIGGSTKKGWTVGSLNLLAGLTDGGWSKTTIPTSWTFGWSKKETILYNPLKTHIKHWWIPGTLWLRNHYIIFFSHWSVSHEHTWTRPLKPAGRQTDFQNWLSWAAGCLFPFQTCGTGEHFNSQWQWAWDHSDIFWLRVREKITLPLTFPHVPSFHVPFQQGLRLRTSYYLPVWPVASCFPPAKSWLPLLPWVQVAWRWMVCQATNVEWYKENACV